MGKRQPKEHVILDGVTATGAGNAVNVRDYLYITLEFSTASSANFTAKLKGSLIAEPSSWAASASTTNRYDTLQVALLKDDSRVDGDTGVQYAGTDAVRLYNVEVDGIDFINLDVTAYSAGTINARIVGYKDA